MNKEDIMKLALKIDLEVSRLCDNGFNHEEEVTHLIEENLNLSMDDNTVYELTLQSFTNKISNIDW